MDYQSSVETVDEVTRQLSVSIPAEVVTQEINSAISGAVQNASIKGFRPGKAPRHLVEKLHGDRIKWEVTNRLVSNSLNDVVKSEKLEMVGSPELDLKEPVETGKELKYSARVFLYPRPEVTCYERFKVKVKKRTVNNEDLDKLIDEMRASKATLRKLEFRNTAQAGDVLDTTANVEIEGEPATRPEPMTIELSEGKVLPEFQSGLAGQEVGETRVVESTIGEDHPNAALRGKKAKYTITLNTIFERVLPEADDEFAKSLNFGAETMLELRMKVREQLEKGAARDSKADVQTEILNQLEAANRFMVPQVMVDDEIRSLLVRAGVLDTSKYDPRQIPMESFRERFGEAAEKRVRTSVIVDRIAEQEKIRPADGDIDAAIAEVAERNQVTVDEVRRFLMESERIEPFILEIVRNKVLEFLESRAEVEQEEDNAAAQQG